SAAGAADVNDIRLALGYDKIDLYGVSYGTRLALTVMRDFPDILRSVVLDSTVPVQADLYNDVARNAQRVFDLLFQSCAADRACNGAFPDLEDGFYQLVARLNAAPVTVQLKHPFTGKSYDFLITGNRLVGALFETFYVTSFIPGLPRVIARARAGDYTPL